jgi:hypothetical protein
MSLTFCSYSSFNGEEPIITARQIPRREEYSYIPSLTTKGRTAHFWQIFENTGMLLGNDFSKTQKLQMVISHERHFGLASGYF